MRTKVLGLTGLACAFGLSACSIRQNAMPVTLTTGENICVVHDAAVRDTVEPILLDALREKGFTARVVSSFNDETCKNKLTYTAKWSWDFTIYMSEAHLTFYRGNTKTGEATYDSKSAGGLHLGKWIDAEEKLREMIDEMFPG